MIGAFERNEAEIFETQPLNYFLTRKEHVPRSSVVRFGGKNSETETYLFDQGFESCNNWFVVKLAEFGTSDFNDDNRK